MIERIQMDLLTEIKERSLQFDQLHAAIAGENSALKTSLATVKIELIDYRRKAHYWEAQFNTAKERETALKKKLAETEAALRKREQQLFGKKTEKSHKKPDTPPNEDEQNNTNKKRGQQRGSQGHGRRQQTTLPQVEEIHDLADDEKQCACCGLPFASLGGTEDSKLIEIINVKAYQRVIRRKRYQKQCDCNIPKTITAPTCDKLFPKTTLGVSVWTHLLVTKYTYHLPLNRVLTQLTAIGLSLATGTVTDGFKKLQPLLAPIVDAINTRSLSATHWHADETGWKVFEPLENKKNNKWYMWIFHNDETVVYKICPSRSSQELIKHFGDEHPGGTLSVDRYSAYKAIAKQGLFILAFCWAHVRRDFLQHAKGYPEQEGWALHWVRLIGNLYHINNKRIQYKLKSKTFRQHHQALSKAIDKMRVQIDAQLADEAVSNAAKKLLESLDRHWDGLTVFIDEPSIPMDNNTAERGLRGPIIGRNGYYGSGAIWSSVLSAMMFTIIKTMQLSKINVHTWLLTYFQECAKHGGAAPPNIDRFLPWHMDEEAKQLFTIPPAYYENEKHASEVLARQTMPQPT